MGANQSKVVSGPERQQNKEVERQLSGAKKADQKIKKLLLVGAGESGKSTFFRQIIDLYGKGYDEQDIKMYAEIVRQNTVAAMKILIGASKTMNLEVKFNQKKTKSIHTYA